MANDTNKSRKRTMAEEEAEKQHSCPPGCRRSSRSKHARIQINKILFGLFLLLLYEYILILSFWDSALSLLLIGVYVNCFGSRL
jgi:uncharacterized membrane protein